ncbi:MAG: VanZ family protein [Thermoguttaceae bacterium]|jgi:VanZ family protein|nr:VanZ family protein [Thermoguttaceae bacterium]
MSGIHTSNSGHRSPISYLLGIVALAVALRLAVGLMEPMSTRSDAGAYLAMAVNVAEGRGLIDSLGNWAYYCPGYPLLLAAVFLLTGPQLGVVLAVNLALSAVTIVLVYRVGEKGVRSLFPERPEGCCAEKAPDPFFTPERPEGCCAEKAPDPFFTPERPEGCCAEKAPDPFFTPERAGLLAALAWAVYVPSIAMANAINKENLMIPLMLGILWCTLAWPDSPRRIALAALAGLLGGLAVLAAITGSVVAGSLAAVILVYGASWRQRAVAAGAFLLTASVVVAPWLYRNYLLFGEPVLKTNSGFVFYMGNNPAATGGYLSIGDTPMAGEWGRIKTEEGELAADREAARRAWRYMFEHPGRTLWMFAKKAALFWQPPNLRSDEPESLEKRILRYTWFVQYLVLMGLALYGLRTFRHTWPLYLAIALYMAIHLPFVVMLRYRLPIMAVVVAVAGSWKLGVGSWGKTLTRSANSQLPTPSSQLLLRSIAVLYALAIVVVTLLPSGRGTPLAGWDTSISPSVQNTLHLPAYAVLVVLLMAAFGRSARRPWLALGLITAGCIAFGLASEWLQAAVIPGRFGSLTDALSNTIGSLLGAGSWRLGVRCQVSGVRKKKHCNGEGLP